MKLAIAFMAGALMLPGCASASPDADQTEPSPKPSSSPAEAVIEVDDYAACGRIGTQLVAVQNAVTAIVEDGTGETVDWPELSKTADELRDIQPLVSPRLDAYFAPFTSVVLQLDDIYEGRSEQNGSLDTGAYRDATMEILRYCVDDIGYEAP